ncbi:hypothetical protein GO755_02700 [Spirosoma sp. HMF4905]|uniref:Peptidase S8 n=1 Tax=Spirosoma arboris TaxID=2682092 RepID=A0A7K1S526_9BACT|nr:hypothetical protein [Spirosoma arboris]MVM28927.1 hypothetical protein [Spirosoma arboris]
MNTLTPSQSKKPPFRKLRGYSFDPALSLKIDTAPISTIVYKVRWEDIGDHEGCLKPGPVGEYVEVIDYDPTVKKFYTPVNLNDPYILAQDGLDPSESNPQFHQQMVYAVAMTTIQNFERALGRKVLWAPQRLAQVTGKRTPYEEYIAKLRIYPHALRDANAYYSPQKKSLLFGYFSSAPADETIQMPASLVFTCLSHDIIAHETTHAILDGMHRHYNEPTNPDVLAFHEAFSDIVALFQHFTFPEVLLSQIRKTRGDLTSENLLGQLAQQFGSAIGSYGSLRDALGEIDEETKKWKPKVPKASEYRTVMEPHARGSILVAAVFEAFTNIYKDRVSDLMRIASNGTGILAQGELPPDLVNRLASEAAKAADHVLQMCIRALDYCPPVDITFGDYLRAIITADSDLVADDSHNYRLVFIDAFRRRGIYPKGIKTLSVESLQFVAEPVLGPDAQNALNVIGEFLRGYRNEIMYEQDRKKIYEITKKHIASYTNMTKTGLHGQILEKLDNSFEFEQLTGLILDQDWKKLGVNPSGASSDDPSFQIQNLRLVSRVGPDGDQVNQIIFSLVQRSGVRMNDDGTFAGHYTPGVGEVPANGFEFRGGCTMIFDLEKAQLKYAITKPLLNTDKLAFQIREIDTGRVEQQYGYQNNDTMMGISDYSHYFGIGASDALNEPFAFLHSH